MTLEFGDNELDGETQSDEVSATAGRTGSDTVEEWSVGLTTAGRTGSDTVEEWSVGLTRMVSVGLLVVVWPRRSSQA